MEVARLGTKQPLNIRKRRIINNQFNFSIDRYESTRYGLNGNYDDFFIYTDLKTNEEFIISPNKEKIKAFCAYINRLTN